jgi:D-alanyl-D-alanine carboxypeptidase (penicillin-binding protein 5/6)
MTPLYNSCRAAGWYYKGDMRQQRRGTSRWWLVPFILVVAGAYVAWALLRPLTPIQPSLVTPPSDSTASRLNWPGGVQAAVGVLGSHILQTSGTQDPLPTASTAKIITALTVLQAKPLKPGEQGPLITLTPADVALYSKYNTQQGSVVRVAAGEQISEYQALETLMLPSANNMADSLANWAFGSLSAYNAAASVLVSQHGLTKTHVGADASGYDPSTTSTAHDLVLAGELAMQNPVLAQIVSQPTASGIPVAGTIKNVNSLLGSNNIIGIKTGNSDQAGGVFVSASIATVNQQSMTIITALMGASDLSASLSNSVALITSAQANFQTIHLVKTGQTVGSYHLPWGPIIPAIATGPVDATAWGGTKLTATITIQPISQTTDSTVGTITSQLDKTTVPVKLQTPYVRPTVKWRLLHPID